MAPASPSAPPDAVRDLAEACVQYVERSLGVALDYEAETLPLLDHYLLEARRSAADKPEALMLAAHAAGAYFGEVVRRRYASWWRAAAADPVDWRIELEGCFLWFSPVALAMDALDPDRDSRGEDEGLSRFEMEAEDQEAAAARLAELPEASDDEFFAPSTRLEVLDIIVDAARARRVTAGEAAPRLRPDDYVQADA